MKNKRIIFISVILIFATLAACGKENLSSDGDGSSDVSSTRPKKNIIFSSGIEENVNNSYGIESYDFSSGFSHITADGDGSVYQGSTSDEEVTLTAAEAFPYLYTTGRTVLAESGICLDWTGSSIKMTGNFSREIKCKITFAGLNKQRYAYLYIIVDGNIKSPRIIKLINGTQRYTIANVSAGEHTLEIIRITEAANGIADVKEFSFSGKLNKAKSTYSKKIEFIGDSITCGAQMDNTADNDADAENGFKSYAMITARNLNAEPSVFSAAGYRLTYADGGKDHLVIPNLYSSVNKIASLQNYRIEQKWDFANNQMDAVVINLGTNDTVLVDLGRKDEIENAAEKFIKTIRGYYPDAVIVWCYGMMSNKGSEQIKQAINNCADPDVYYLELPQNNGGLANHPNEEGHAAAAAVLTSFLQEKLK